MKGTTIASKYRVGEKLGEGGMGSVFEATNTTTGRRVAVKIISKEASIHGSEEARMRFERETRAAGAIESQHIAQILDAGIDPESGAPFMVMEHLEGEDLRTLMERKGVLPPELALRIVTQAALGLEKAHAAGFIHRDVKPANIFLMRRDAGELVVKVLDFGVAKMSVDHLATREGDALTRTGTLIGSPRYMSPEQARGAKTLDHRTDVWGLGAVLYEMLGGTTPHDDAESLGELILMLCSKDVVPVRERAPWVSPSIAAVVDRCLMTKPSDRYRSMADLVKATSALLPNGSSIAQSMVDEIRLHDEVSVAETPRPRALERANTTLTSTIPPPETSATPPPAPSAVSPTSKEAAHVRSSRSERRRAFAPVVAGASAMLVVAALVFLAVEAGSDPPLTAVPKAPSIAPPPTPLSLPSVTASGSIVIVAPVDPTTEPTSKPKPKPKPSAHVATQTSASASASSAAPRASTSASPTSAELPGIVKDTSEFGR